MSIYPPYYAQQFATLLSLIQIYSNFGTIQYLKCFSKHDVWLLGIINNKKKRR